jgi:hypothetical protein
MFLYRVCAEYPKKMLTIVDLMTNPKNIFSPIADASVRVVGVGIALVHAAEKQCLKEGLRGLRGISDYSAIRFCERLGFVMTGNKTSGKFSVSGKEGEEDVRLKISITMSKCSTRQWFM